MKLYLTLALSISWAAVASAAEPFPEPRSPDDLIANFERAINERRVDEYARALHPEFTFIFAREDRSLVSPDTSWGKASELRSMSRLLSGEEGLSHLGDYIPPATAIKFGLVPVDEWSQMLRGDEISETWTRTYHALLRVEFADGRRHTVSRRQTFTLTARRSEHDLRATQFQMTRWMEHGRCSCQGRSIALERARF